MKRILLILLLSASPLCAEFTTDDSARLAVVEMRLQDSMRPHDGESAGWLWQSSADVRADVRVLARDVQTLNMGLWICAGLLCISIIKDLLDVTKRF